jgi:hypothetical protein
MVFDFVVFGLAIRLVHIVLVHTILAIHIMLSGIERGLRFTFQTDAIGSRVW